MWERDRGLVLRVGGSERWMNREGFGRLWLGEKMSEAREAE